MDTSTMEERRLRLTKSEILDSINSIIEDKETLNKRSLENKWMNFMNTYPMIFLQLIDSDTTELDMSLIEDMVNRVALVDKGEKDIEEMELDVGNELAERYVYTKFERPSGKQLMDAYKKALDNKYNKNENN